LIIDTQGSKPIYVQIAEWLEAEILRGHFDVDEKVYSQYQLADMFTINPATASKGLQILAEENIVYKKRGLGMFVSEQATEIILHKRKNKTLKHMVTELVLEAERLHVDEKELLDMIQTARKKVRGNEDERD
jgi:GntR family transcriptional regulator